MNIRLRLWMDRCFTVLALLAVAMIVASLLGILLPMLWRGSSAVLFRGTVDFRRMQLEQFNRGDSAAVHADMQAASAARQHACEILDHFAMALDPSPLEIRVKQIHREFAVQVANRDLPAAQAGDLRAISKQLRDTLLKAFEDDDNDRVLAQLDIVLSHASDASLRDSIAEGFFDVARQYRQAVAGTDLHRRAQYAEGLKQVKQAMTALLGPRPGDRLPTIPLEQYGSTRWDQATQEMDSLLWTETWTASSDGKRLKVRTPREQQFAGTQLAELFPYMRDNMSTMLCPRWVFYWQFFTDDNISGHYFGGVGPEILGTLLVTLLAIALALPVGVITAGYLVECAGDNAATRLVRMCINTLAGVPSIVFGLFGLAFFAIYLLPKLGLPEGSSILAGSLTLALLVLPVIIRASEEAIRSVPRSYREASLALGAGRFRCFVTVTLPAAMPGILTGLILSMSRAAGETAPILFTAGVAMGPPPTSIMQPTRTLSYSSYDMAVGDKMAALAPHNQFGMVMTLVGIVLTLNIVAIVLRCRMAKKLRGH